MPSKKKVENNPSLERDTSNSAIINTNADAYAARRTQIKAVENKRKLDERQTEDINLRAMLLKSRKCY
jgi:hypothetical protein